MLGVHKMKKIIYLTLILAIACSCITMTACDQVKKVPGGEFVVSSVEVAGNWLGDGFNNIKDSALNKINGDIDNFMKEHNIPADKKDEILGLAKQWAKTALTASGEIDKAKDLAGYREKYAMEHGTKKVSSTADLLSFVT